MKSKIFILILFFAAQSLFAQNVQWSDNSARTVEKSHKEIGIFSPFTMGLTESLELSVHPIWFFMTPHIHIKKYWTEISSFHISSLHRLSYETPILKMLSKNGTGGVLPPTREIPQFIKLNNALLIGKSYKEQYITLQLGVDFAYGFGNSTMPDIEYFLVYPRTYALNHLYTPYVALDVTGTLYKKIDYNYHTDNFFLTGENVGFITEQAFQLIWRKSEKFNVRIGAIYTIGDFPYGKGNKILPTIDCLWAF